MINLFRGSKNKKKIHPKNRDQPELIFVFSVTLKVKKKTPNMKSPHQKKQFDINIIFFMA